MLGHQGMQLRDAFGPFGQPSTSQPSAWLVLYLDVVVILSPIVADEDHENSSFLLR
jgi:hypothetical protein